MGSKAICGRLQKLESEISQLVAQHLKNFQKERDARAKKCQDCCSNKVERKRSSSEPARGKENQAATCFANNHVASQPPSRQHSPNRNYSPNYSREASPKRTSIIKPSNNNDNVYTNENKCTCNHKTKHLCKCCQKKSVQFSRGLGCTPRKTYTVEELFKIKGRLSSTSQRNPCICEYPPKENIEDEILGDTLNIQTTLFQMPSMKETFKSFDSRTILAEKLQALENENKRLNDSLKDEARLRKAFMEEAKREIRRTEKMMDEKMANMHKQAMESLQQVAAVNNNLAGALGDKEETLQKMSNVAAKLKIEQEREKCKCKLVNNVCRKLQERNEELEKEKEAIDKEIAKIRADNERLKSELRDYNRKIDSLSNEVGILRKQKEELQETYHKTARRAESQLMDLKRKKEIETELNKLTNVLKQTEQERGKLDRLVKELRETILSQKERIEELIRLNEEHAVLLKSQKAALDSKDEQLRLSEAEATIIKRNSFALEQRLTSAEESLKAARDYSQELEKARQEIAELKDTILLKENIISDQSETLTILKKESERNASHINRLRKDIDIKTMEIERYKRECEKQAQALQKAQQEAALIAEEFRKATMKTSESITRVKRMGAEMGSQNAQKQGLLQDIAILKQENDDLRNQVDELQEKLENVCHYTSAGDMEKQQLLITYLEQQVALQQREWEIQKRVINKEKSKALQTAKFATKKLLETVQDFQKQTEMQRKVHTMLTNMLQEKEDKLHKITSKMVTNTKPPLQKIEEVNEVCTKEFRVPVVRRSIYSPQSDVTVGGGSSNNESSVHEEDEESLEVASTSRLLPRQDDTIYGPRARRNQEKYSPSFRSKDVLPEEETCSVCYICTHHPCQCNSSRRHSKTRY